jgi:tRNA threonylcarbamoyladenosine biosynthesis protein TsaE
MPSHSRDQEQAPGNGVGSARLERLDGSGGSLVIASDSPARTLSCGALIGSLIPPGTVLSLEGGLGAGKTLLAKGICAGLGVPDEVLSPSFILVEEYRGMFPVFHFDLYRLEHVHDVAGIGLLEAVDGRAVVIVEWGDRLPEGMLEVDVRVVMRITGPERREITVEGCRAMLAALAEGMR